MAIGKPDTVWRYTFAVKNSPQILGWWGMWTLKRDAAKELRKAKRRFVFAWAYPVEVRRVPCRVVLPTEYPTGEPHAR